MMGLLKGKDATARTHWITTTYGSRRESKFEYLYWQTLCAYRDAIEERRMKGEKRKRGLLVETAWILEKRYGWEFAPDSYTVRRYLDRAEKVWHVSTK